MFMCCWQKMTWHSRRFHSECMTVKYCATSPSEINGVTLATPPCCAGKLSEVQLKYFLHSGRTGRWTFLMQLWSYVLTNVTISDGHVFTLYHCAVMITESYGTFIGELQNVLSKLKAVGFTQCVHTVSHSDYSNSGQWALCGPKVIPKWPGTWFTGDFD